MSNGHLRTALPPLRTGRPATPSLIERRGSINIPEERIGEVPCTFAGASGATVRILHLHGGGYRMGSAAGWQPFAERLATATGARVIVPDYALAPERPFPAALHDALAVLEYLFADPRPLILSGDSAGGGLALALAAALAPPTPLAGLALLSPWLDLTQTAESFAHCGPSDRLFSHASAQEAAETYLQGSAPDHPMASPLFADLSDLPPVLLMASTSEVLRDDAIGLVDRLARSGRRADVAFEPEMAHVWPVLFPSEPASHRALDRYARFVAAVSSDCVGSSVA